MSFFKKRIYMDFASASPLHPRVQKEMQKTLAIFGNPSAPHEEGKRARALLDSARISVARALSVKSDSLYFTSSGTESNNLAVQGVIDSLIERGARCADLHVITSAFEHPSLLEPIKALERKGVSVSYVLPTSEGIITPEAVQKLITTKTVLVSVVAVQSELGMIQPLKDISRMLEPYRKQRTQDAQSFVPESPFPIFHTDASQGSLFVDLSPDRLGVDMATYDGQKIMGPKGVGVLYKHSAVSIVPFIRGGSQERKLRPGTPNAPSIHGMALALEIAVKNRKQYADGATRVRDFMIELIKKRIPHAEINGNIKNRIANNIHISIPGTDGDYVSILMDKRGVAVSPRSACIASGEISNSIQALGKSEREAHGTLRFTLSPWATKGDAKRAVTALEESLAVIDSK